MRGWLGMSPVKLDSTNCRLQGGLKASCMKEFKMFLSCPEIALTILVFPDIYVVTPTEGRSFQRAEEKS